MRFVPGEFSAISPASVATTSSRSCSGQARSTSPRAAASAPVMRRLVNISSLAREGPMRSGRRTDIPQMGASPH